MFYKRLRRVRETSSYKNEILLEELRQRVRGKEDRIQAEDQQHKSFSGKERLDEKFENKK